MPTRVIQDQSEVVINSAQQTGSMTIKRSTDQGITSLMMMIKEPIINLRTGPTRKGPSQPLEDDPQVSTPSLTDLDLDSLPSDYI